MALTDLKKNSTPSTNRRLSVEEFIADAEHYAMGALSSGTTSIATVVAELATPATAHLEHGPMRHATFTLSQAAIDVLNQLSHDTGMSKSKLIRQLIFSANELALTREAPAVVVKQIE